MEHAARTGQAHESYWEINVANDEAQAVLHLAAALLGQPDTVPAFTGARPFFHAGMSYQYDHSIGAGTNATLFESTADAISPRHVSDRLEAYKTDPPAADGSKVILLDTDHLWGIGGDATWVWKAFTRGMNPIFMDPYQKGAPPGKPQLDPKWEGLRQAMGVTRQLAQRINLAAMTPRPNLSSTRYCLAHPGHEYLAYLPDGGNMTVDLTAAPATFAVAWINPEAGATMPAPSVAGGAKRAFKAPFAGPAVLYLHAGAAKSGP